MQKGLRRYLLTHKKGLLFVLFLIYLYFRGISDHGLLDPLEGVNASVSLDMLITGSAFSPHVGEAASAGRALGAWWLSALSLRFLGLQESAVRLWPALSGLLMTLAAVLAVRGRGKWLTAAVSASLTLGFAVSQLASPHALYACCTAFAMAAMLRPRGRPFIAAAVLAALLVYGLEGLILPWVALFIFALVTDRLEVLRPYLPALGFSLLGAGVWLLLLWVRNPLLLRFMFSETPHFLRPTWQLAAAFVLGGSLPWTGFLIRAIRDAVAVKDSEGDGSPAENPALFMAIWALAFALGAFLTGDLPALAACVPPLAALTGFSLAGWLEKGEMEKFQEAVALNLVILAPAVAAIPFVSRSFPLLQGALMSLAPWGLLLIIFTFMAWHYAKTRQAAKLVRNVSAIALLCLMPLAGVFDLMAERTSVRDIGLALRRCNIRRGDVVVQYAVNRPSLYFYTLTPYATIDSPLLPGVEKSELTVTALHLIWDGRDRAFLILPRSAQPKQALPQDTYSVFEGEELMLLSNRYN